MAITIIGNNLNIFGDSGAFASDRSTWGFNDGTYWVATRANYTSPGDNLVCRNYIDAAPALGMTLTPASILTPAVGKKYIAKCIIKIDVAGDKPYTTGSLRISPKNYDKISDTNFPIADFVGVWKEIELRFEHPGGTLPSKDIEIEIYSTSGGGEGVVYVDDFTIFEYTDDPPPTCTVEIDVDNTVVVNESAPAAADGSITVAITGGQGNITYSKNGVDYQSSNQFTGLTADNYTITVKDDFVAFCSDSQIFSVNLATLTFDFTGAVTDESISGAADGQIDITVTGTGGPFTYSKDGGQTYQGSNIFADLAPGDYSIVVKDDSNNTLGKIFTVEPGLIIFQESSFSENPIPFTRPETSNSGEDNYQIYLDVRVEEVAGTGIYTSKLTTAKPPEADGFARYNLRPAFRGIFDQEPPDLNEGNIIKLTDRIKLYKIFYGDLFDEKTVPDTLTGTNPYLVQKGGVSKRAYPTINYLTSYLAANKKFLTWAPIQKEVDYGQEDYLNFYLYDTDFNFVKLVIKAYFDDDTTETNDITELSGLAYGNLVQVPAGPLNSGAIGIDPAKNMTKYDLWLEDAVDVVISEVRTYIITPFKHPRTRYYLLTNSLGAYEVIRTIGFSEQSAELERTFIEKLLPTGYDADDGQFRNGSSIKRAKTKVSTGFYSGVLAKEWMEYAQQIALSNKVFDITNGERIPQINTTKGVVFEQNENNKRFARLDFIEAYEDENYTPEST